MCTYSTFSLPPELLGRVEQEAFLDHLDEAIAGAPTPAAKLVLIRAKQKINSLLNQTRGHSN